MKKTLIILASVIVLGGGAYAIYASQNQTWPFSDSSKVSETNSEPDMANDNKDEGSKQDPDNTNGQSDNENRSPIDKTPIQYESPKNPIPPDQLTGVINYKSVADGKLVIRNTINQSISGGSCEMVMTHQSTRKVVTKNAPIVVNPHSSTCQGFDISTSELSSGSWDINITITGDGKKGTLKDSVSI